MSKIAVIGCGVFGAVTALKLGQLGFDVTVFERHERPLSSASLNNQNRLHQGFHYPRDSETAQQCIDGFQRFIDEFPDCIRPSFPNAYFIASEGSRVSFADYLKFCDALKLPYAPIENSQFPFALNRIEGGICCSETVYDSKLLADEILSRFPKSSVKIQTSTEVTSARNVGQKIELELNGINRESFDAVVNASYANINLISSKLGHSERDHRYEYTLVPIIEMEAPPFGITVMDGPFWTVLPFGKSSKHLLYHVDHSVVEAYVGKQLKQSWLDQASSPFKEDDARHRYEQMVEIISSYVGDLPRTSLSGFLHGPRMVLANRDDTDARPSIVEPKQPNYLTVFSGKIDHSVWVADEVATHMTNYFSV